MTFQTPTIQILEELYAQRDLLAMDKAAQQKQVIPAEVQEELEAIDSEFADREKLIAKRIEEAEVYLTQAAKDSGKKITGSFFYVQYTKSSKRVKVEDVLRVADRFEKTVPEVAIELRSIITMSKPSATIKPVGT